MNDFHYVGDNDIIFGSQCYENWTRGTFKVVEIMAGYKHYCVRTKDDKYFLFGKYFGTNKFHPPVCINQVHGLHDKRIKSVFLGCNNTKVIVSN